MREGKHEHRGSHPHGEHRGPRGGRGRSEEDRKQFRSAQTFRRGRALAFLERLQVKRHTLVQQLEQPEYAEIKSVISGELKATDAIIQEFIHMFELQETQEVVQDQQADEAFNDAAEVDSSKNQQTEDASVSTEPTATEQETATPSTDIASTDSTPTSNHEQ